MDNHHALLNRLHECPSPCFVVDEVKLAKNGEYCQEIREKTGAIILLALKGYAMTSTFNTLRPYLDGTTASSLHELRCGAEHMPSPHQHIFSPAFIESEWDDIQRYASHISFNSLSNWEQFKEKCSPLLSVGLRINPEHSEVRTELYNPCKTNSRLGCLASELEAANLEGIEGFHFHTLCQSQFPELERTVEVIETKFSKYLHQLKWLNLGGGHHLTDPNYDRDGLCHLINRLQKTYNLTVILEPGEAIALNAGYFVCTVVDILNRAKKQAILDTSASTHLADVLEMPFRPHILGSHDAKQTVHNYILGGLTCLAGDTIGEYSFDKPLKLGQKLVLTDMAHYTMVKTTTFNGIKLPSIATLKTNGELTIEKTFSYEDYLSRLA